MFQIMYFSKKLYNLKTTIVVIEKLYLTNHSTHHYHVAPKEEKKIKLPSRMRKTIVNFATIVRFFLTIYGEKDN